MKYIFSDKTGTLTENKMIFRQCSIGGVVYGDPNSTQENYIDTTLTQNLRINSPQAAVIHDFLLAISLCHTVVTEPNPDQPNKPVYLAASPDESALVKAAASLDYTFLKRDVNHIVVRARSRADNRGGEPKYGKIFKLGNFFQSQKNFKKPKFFILNFEFCLKFKNEILNFKFYLKFKK